MTTKRKVGPDDDWLLASWQLAGELAQVRDYVVQLSLVPTTRRGVWKVQARALHVVDSRLAGIACQVTCDFPGGDVAGLGARVYRLLHELDQELAVKLMMYQAPA